jgi:Beta-glucanase/Beta-glucan synthetase
MLKRILILGMLVFLASCSPQTIPSDLRTLVDEDCGYLENIDDWQPVWCDEFDVDGLPNPEHWGYDVGGHGWGNLELQYYTREALTNAVVEDGILSIHAIRESVGQNEYTSARLVSKYRGDWLYGRIQIRAKCHLDVVSGQRFGCYQQIGFMVIGLRAGKLT